MSSSPQKSPSSLQLVMASNMVIHGRANPLRTCTTLKEALLLPSKNPTLILSVFLISSLATSIYLSAYLLSVYRLLTDLANTPPSSSAYYDLLKLLIAVEVVLVVGALIITFILRTITIYALAATYTGKLLAFRELRRKARGMMKGPLITQLCVLLLSLGYVVLLAAFWVAFSSAARGSALWIPGVVVASVVAVAAYLYLATWWSLSIAVSVVEQGCYGMGAMKRAAELMGEGRKWTGVAVVGTAVVVVGALSAVYGLVLGTIPRGVWIQVGAVLVYNLEMEVVSLFLMAAIAVYYYECRRARGEDVSRDAIGDVGYASVPATDAV